MFYADNTVTEIIGQLLIALFFIKSGIPNVRNHVMWTNRMREQKVPLPKLALFGGFAVQFLGAILVLIDFYAGTGAIMLVVFTVASALLFQRYWDQEDSGIRLNLRLAFWANVCVVGGLFLLV
jgi:uncharacterized membrane protein YphA (DoxX/SURF4 family)